MRPTLLEACTGRSAWGWRPRCADDDSWAPRRGRLNACGAASAWKQYAGALPRPGRAVGIVTTRDAETPSIGRTDGAPGAPFAAAIAPAVSRDAREQGSPTARTPLTAGRPMRTLTQAPPWTMVQRRAAQTQRLEGGGTPHRSVALLIARQAADATRGKHGKDPGMPSGPDASVASEASNGDAPRRSRLRLYGRSARPRRLM